MQDPPQYATKLILLFFEAFILEHFLLVLCYTSEKEKSQCSCMFVCTFNTFFYTINRHGQTRCDCRKRRRLQ